MYTAPDGSVRLIGGNGPHEGRVEILQYGVWGTVCGDGWDTCDATVVCRQLGYPHVIAHFVGTTYGLGRGPIWLDEVACNGTESNLTECGKNAIGDSDCSHSEDVGVLCSTEGRSHLSAAVPCTCHYSMLIYAKASGLSMHEILCN